MTGKIVYRKPQPHRCAQGTGENGRHTGDVWQCDECGRTWVYKVDVGYWAWKPESVKAKRRREAAQGK